ncbi:MAG: DNA endonuclease SmrA [Methylococcales bacterium]|nr:DNA endonuclease SmrA [Methylococcales bacterium]
MTENEINLFAQEMADVLPLNVDIKVDIKGDTDDTPGKQYRREQAAYNKDEVDCPLSLILRNTLKSDDWLCYKRNGIQSGVFKNLKVGKYPQEATLNLNKKSPRQARDELVQFVDDCQEMNIRSVLIFFGHGNSGNCLKSYLAQWLPELKMVQAFHTAQKHHSGQAAVYVLLQKSETKKMENRERHAARLGDAL